MYLYVCMLDTKSRVHDCCNLTLSLRPCLVKQKEEMEIEGLWKGENEGKGTMILKACVEKE